MRSIALGGLTLVSLASLGGCGSGQPSGLDDEVGEESAGESDSGTTNDGAGDEACFVDGALTKSALLLAFGLDQATLIGPEGERLLELSGPPGDILHGAVADATMVFIARSVWPAATTRVHAFERTSGALAWTVDVESLVYQLWVGDDGSLVGSTDGGGGIRIVDGQLSSFEQVPLGGVREAAIAARETDGQGFLYAIGWLDVASSAWVVAPDQPATDNTPVHVEGATHEFLAPLAGEPALFRVAPSASEVIPLPPLAGFTTAEVSVIAQAGPLRLLLGQGLIAALVRVDVDSGEVVLIDPEPPPGYERFDCYSPGYGLDRSGAVLFELRDQAAAQLFAYAPEQQSWTPLGRPIGLVDDIYVAFGGTGSVHVLTSIEWLTTFCPLVEWGASPAGALLGTTTQVVRLEPPLALELPGSLGFQAWVDSDERCVAYYQPGEPGSWRVLGLDEGGSASFGDGQWLWLD